MVSVVYYGSTKTPSWVNASSSNGNCSQVNQKHSKPNWKRCQNRNVRVSCISLGISGREDSVDKNKSTNNLSSKTITLGVTRIHNICSTFVQLITSITFKALHYAGTTDSPKTLHYYVEYCSCQGQLPSQKQTECHCWIYVPT
uniref:Uncharacterized protein n=1 Tax=Medicago truncatula TaxID=3880 RepID=I3S0L4_MEDTR|nr:unknown [Medicago truncatula]